MGNKYQPYNLEIKTLGFYVDRLLYAMIKKQNQMLKESPLDDLQHSEFIVLKVLNVLDGVTQSQLASVMGKERSSISRSVASLEKKGYIDRKPLNGSTNFITLTEKGRQSMNLITEISDKLTDLTFKGFSAQKRQSVVNSLARLFKNASES